MISAKEARKKTNTFVDPKILNACLEDINKAIHKAIAKGKNTASKTFHINKNHISQEVLSQLVEKLEKEYGYTVFYYDFWIENQDTTLHIYW